MREITIGKNDAGQRLDRFVSKSGTSGSRRGTFCNYTSTTSSLTSPGRTIFS